METNFMAKLKADLDVKAFWARALEKSGLKHLSQLAEAIGLTPQSLNATTARKSISLPYVMLVAEHCKTTIDYLIYGGDEGEVKSRAEKLMDDNHIEISMIVGVRTVKLPVELLKSNIDVTHLQAYIRSGSLYIIDVSDLDVSDGLFAFRGNNNRPLIKLCRENLQGDLTASDEHLGNTELLQGDAIVLGRVIWSGSPVS
jgi:hypothetical protein